MIYLLSILDGLNTTCSIAGALILVGGAILLAITLGLSADLTRVSEQCKPDEERLIVLVKFWRNIAIGAGASLLLASALLPTTQSLMRAYVMTEGAKVMTADNAEAATKALLERADKLIEAIGKR